MGSTLHGPDTEQGNHMQLSLDQFSTLTQDHLTELTRAQQSLQRVSTPFKEKGDIRPVHCRIALESLGEISEYIQEMCGLLRSTASLPIVISALRYQLLLILHRIEEQIDNLVDLLNSYRLICIAPSSQAFQKRKEIYGSFERLSKHLSDISQEAKLLEDEAKFQERKIMAKLEEQPSTDRTNSDSHGRLYIVKQYENDINVS